MNQLNYYFTNHWGGSPLNSDVVLYEATWNNYGYHGIFEFQIRKKIRYSISKTLFLYICRVDGTMKKRHELREIYSHSDKCFTKLNSSSFYISFPSKDLCLGLLLNFSLEQRKAIAQNLCFNFGEGSDFEKFKTTEQYRVSILRYRNEKDFLNSLYECKKILFCELALSELLDCNDIKINETL